MDKWIALVRASIVDVVGLGFVGAALALGISGHYGSPAFVAFLSLGSGYLGLKTPTP